nr:MAG TPA: hypothetical protein [Bacteriophage sp.]
MIVVFPTWVLFIGKLNPTNCRVQYLLIEKWRLIL